MKAWQLFFLLMFIVRLPEIGKRERDIYFIASFVAFVIFGAIDLFTEVLK